MKTLGRVNKGDGYIVELSNQEHEALFNLVVALDGRAPFFDDAQHPAVDLSPALASISAYASYRDLVSQLAKRSKSFLDELDNPKG